MILHARFNATAAHKAIEKVVSNYMGQARATLVGADAYLNYPHSRYWGRLGRVTALMISEDEIKALLMIYRHDSFTEFLSSAPDTRTYWPLKRLKFVNVVIT